MSELITQVFQNAYDSEVKRSYGDKAVLRQYVYTKTNVEGSKVYFRKKGKGFATEHVRSAEITPMNVDYSQVGADLKNYDAFDYVDKMDLRKFNFSEAKETADVCTDAIGLRLDQIVIDALAVGYDSTHMKVGDGSAAMSINNLLAAKKLMDKKGVPSDERAILISAQQLEDLLKTTQITSEDYNTVKALVNGSIDTFLGFKFQMLADRDEGGLPLASSKRTAFAFHKRAVGLGIGQEIQTRIDWIGNRSSWLVGADFSAGAAVIDTNGVVGIQTAES